ncbi:DegT/DnrJ/EryC1/StrS family aminotransferase [Mesorhizobium sp. RP14(2022)]|uniref:DegT/DnrJ/EryC1/StrS family aminotransferase n=1 Tax=Mesorhizobium liriopis TaxID=2953882 RepID=A0ABT1C5R4_9HYPH|nr:DegT/DnrJ/EryC1/StrS family aminotransferase [Mesorhizobium liriopis]MCO6050163.1 DegT/DnrJ/EryC1/StrS family aminotransferase [Mesorhizobium liriopis]
MIPLCVPNLAGNEGAYLAECVSSTFVSSVGPFVSRFEHMVAEAAGTTGAVATASGTAALHAALLVVGVRPGDLVICPALTFIASANAIAHCGASPWLLDISHESWTLDSAIFARAITKETVADGNGRRHVASGRRVAAVVPVFTLGTPADMDPILDVAWNAGLPVVVDAAAALGASYKGRSSGDLGAQLTMYSFNGNKTVTAGGGGAIAGSDQKLIDAFRHLTTTARVGADYDHDRVGYNYRMTNLQAAVGCAQMEQLDTFIAAKRRIAARYNEAFHDVPDARPFPRPSYCESGAWFSGLLLDAADGPERSEMLRNGLRAAGIDARPFWKPMHFQAPYRDAPRSALPVSEYLWNRIVTLPCSTHLSDEDQAHVIAETLRLTHQPALRPVRAASA